MENTNTNASRESDFIIDVSDLQEVQINYGSQTFVDNPSNSRSRTETPISRNEWRIGQKYCKKLSLSENQINLLDRLAFNNNVFNEIDFCRVQILKQFLRMLDYFDRDCKPVNRAYATVLDELTEIIIVLEYNYRRESLNYKYTFESIQSEILNHLLKLCENNVREVYAIKRKINADFKYTKPEITDKYNKKIVLKADVFLEINKHQVLDADHRTNIILNETTTNRWKDKYEYIVSDYSSSVSFEREIERLAEVNRKNPSLDTIYYEASKFISTYDKNASLRLYFHYLEIDLNSSKFDRKQLTKSIQKNLFSTSEQFEDFENIVNEFILNKNLKIAFESLNKIYLPKRKKLVIDRSEIDRVQKLDLETSQKLGDLLADENEVPDVQVSDLIPQDDDNIQFNVTKPIEAGVSSKYLHCLNLNDTQQEVLDYFEKNGMNILQSDFEDFMRTKQLFVSATLESINDTLYDVLDDVLIEEDEDYFIINNEYFKKLLNND
ncbi:tellurite resistance TerB C-terminal domain-containing protein [Chryseobacterium foetidum]|uniref:tellurite resistance TerB C-terminal domain-containing protein n=1 Tax=Chryseobacterium foetidum TaxID=2951057 RepID=UPI0021C90D8B|nr:tellurite resistance TerB C-terminal domain-containing protein [Chryseobacterium foetidum]